MGQREIATVGLVGAGAMGSALGRTWRDRGLRAITSLTGRSDRTTSLVREMSIEALPELDDVVAAADVVIVVGPPGHAVGMNSAVAEAARRTGGRPIVADCNAISPGTVVHIAEVIAEAGLDFVDGAISGPPPRPGGATSLYLSGPVAPRLTALATEDLRVRVVGERIGQASAVKMCTASIYKGFTALLIQALQTANVHEVVDVVLDDLSGGFPDQVTDAAGLISMAASKSSRFIAEMHEIAATQGEAGARPELFDAMAAVYAAVALSGDAELSPEQAARRRTLEEVLEGLRPRAGSQPSA